VMILMMAYYHPIQICMMMKTNNMYELV
jgi:hypothetical protein